MMFDRDAVVHRVVISPRVLDTLVGALEAAVADHAPGDQEDLTPAVRRERASAHEQLLATLDIARSWKRQEEER